MNEHKTPGSHGKMDPLGIPNSDQVDTLDETAYELAYKILRPYDVKMAVVDELKAKLSALLVDAERAGIIWATGASSLSPEDIKVFQDRIKELEKQREA